MKINYFFIFINHQNYSIFSANEFCTKIPENKNIHIIITVINVLKLCFDAVLLKMWKSLHLYLKRNLSKNKIFEKKGIEWELNSQEFKIQHESATLPRAPLVVLAHQQSTAHHILPNQFFSLKLKKNQLCILKKCKILYTLNK